VGKNHYPIWEHVIQRMRVDQLQKVRGAGYHQKDRVNPFIIGDNLGEKV
jgi:hypothetical protein